MILELDGLSHRYGEEPAVSDVSFGIGEGELVALLGPSGCGKTTIVQAIAGHITPTAGRVRLRDRDVTDVPPEGRAVGIVFQRSTLYPHMTVHENVAYGLDARGVDPARRDDTVLEYLDLVDLADQRDSRPGELSGGQQRRAELARALAPEPDVLLLDEPLSALDRTLRTRLRDEIARIQRETGVTTLFVTHDQEEAMSLADRLVILREGRLSAVGDPRSLYHSPPNRFVASFLGRSNALPATVAGRDPLTIVIGETEVELGGGSNGVKDGSNGIGEAAAPIVHVRPADVVVGPSAEVATDVELPGTVSAVKDVGSRYEVHVRLASGDTVLTERRRAPPEVNDRVTVGVDYQNLAVFW
ncbi:ABC transporter ATP-binding protein [Halorubrum sp. DTA98]|uniref:ABC transporter ATP-binding protein n=1 Tax=Halorubrum sp. DTA98 TaxID=3402163 RepID=UPI003AB0E422